MIAWIAVGLLGGVGAVARVLVDDAVSLRVPRPAGIFVVNISGAFVLGVLAGAAVHGDAYLLAGTATLGAYTTFSTWMADTERLAGEGRTRAAAANLALSLVAGLAAAALGHALGVALG